jgi:hypothetical protein
VRRDHSQARAIHAPGRSQEAVPVHVAHFRLNWRHPRGGVAGVGLSGVMGNCSTASSTICPQRLDLESLRLGHITDHGLVAPVARTNGSNSSCFGGVAGVDLPHLRLKFNFDVLGRSPPAIGDIPSWGRTADEVHPKNHHVSQQSDPSHPCRFSNASSCRSRGFIEPFPYLRSWLDEPSCRGNRPKITVWEVCLLRMLLMRGISREDYRGYDL